MNQIKKIIYPIYSTIIAIILLFLLWITKRENEIIIILHPYIGDQLYALSCLGKR